MGGDTMGYFDHVTNTSFSDESYFPIQEIHRFLGGGGGGKGGGGEEEYHHLDYSVISVLVTTLGMILVVEVLRHQLDVAASGNPFFRTVLELVYRELTTLGIVEFFIYRLHNNYKNFNYEMEAVFVDVHFMLFYTAVFNAIQSVLVRVLTSRHTDKTWVKTEEMELGHYVAIRKEFDRVDHRLAAFKDQLRGSSDENLNENPALSYSTRAWIKNAMIGLIVKIKHPRLTRKRRMLLVQVRFHELRAHFIDSNKLPHKFKVSHYLKRSLTSALLDFVHISSFAWIMLMATGNLIYFLSGIILNESRNAYAVAEFLIDVSFAFCGLFVIIAVVLYMKMNSIFSRILHLKLTALNSQSYSSSEDVYTALGSGVRAFNQLELFWGGDPHLILAAAQYMQFGYAIGIAIIFTYWKDILVDDAPLDTTWLLIAIICSYAIFLYLVVQIVPTYTLCTSMGQLVNNERLQETLAKLKLSEEVRKKKFNEFEKRTNQEIMKRKWANETNIGNYNNGRGEGVQFSKATRSFRGDHEAGGIGIKDTIFTYMKSYPNRLLSQPNRRRQRNSSDWGNPIRSTTELVAKSGTPSGARNDVKQSIYDGDTVSNQLANSSLDSIKGVEVEYSPFDNANNDNPPTKPLSEHESMLSPDLSAAARLPPNNALAINAPLTREEQNKVKLEGTSNITIKSTKKSPLIFEPQQDKVAPRSRIRSFTDKISLTKSAKVNKDVNPGYVHPKLPKPASFSNHTDMLSTPSQVDTFSSSKNDSAPVSDAPFEVQEDNQSLNLSKSPPDSLAIAHSNHASEQSLVMTPTLSVEESRAESKLEILSELAHTSTEDLPDIPYDRKNKSSTHSEKHEHSSIRNRGSTNNSFDLSSPTSAQVSRLSTTDNSESNYNNYDYMNHGGYPGGKTSLPSKNSSHIDDDPSRDPKAPSMRKIIQNELVLFFQSMHYRALSGIFGPMICFFIIGMRVEDFNKKTGALKDQGDTWDLNLLSLFWIEVAWYCGMMLELLFVIFLFLKEDPSSSKSFSCVAASLGILVNAICLLLLLLAESQRCCDNDGNDDNNDCCPDFGKRTYGGLGSIEPFTALIALSPLRFFIASFISNPQEKETSLSENPSAEFHSGSSRHHGPDVTTKARELWLAAIGIHSDIAKTYGIFSGELLQCMLGISILEGYYAEHKLKSDSSTMKSPFFDNSGAVSENNQVSSVEGTHVSSAAVENVKNLGVDRNTTTKPEMTTTNINHGQTNTEEDLILFDDVMFPATKLILAMRRCEMRLMPLLNEWMVIDAVLTNHELILFDAFDCDGALHNVAAENEFSITGGKGMLLNAISRGRNILSQFELADVQGVNIECFTACDIEKESDDIECQSQYDLEFWQGGKLLPNEYNADVINRRWLQVDENRLKICFGCGTLFLRFMVDLKQCEGQFINSASSSKAEVEKNVGSILWYDTIARLQRDHNTEYPFGKTEDEFEESVEVYESQNEDFLAFQKSGYFL